MKFIIAIALSVFCVCSANAASYWVSYWIEDINPGIYLMKIDDTGNVLKTPKRIVSRNVINKPFDVVTAMSFANDKILLTALTNKGDAYVFTIDPVSVSILSKKKVTLPNKDQQYIQETQPAPRFLVVENPLDTVQGRDVNGSGIPQATKFRASPRTDKGSAQASISADGLMAVNGVFNAPFAIYVQPLGASGRPVGDPSVVDTAITATGIDITNLLADGNRFVLYTEDSTPPGFPTDDVVFLQVVDGTTGAKIGQPITINIPPNRHEDPQTLAVDPEGKFVLFTLNVDGVPHCDQDVIEFQALDSTGHPSGNFIQVSPCTEDQADAVGLDILEVQ